jgi:hypothetical protein
MGAPVRSNAQIVADYLDSVLNKDHSAVDRFFHPDVEYMINGSPAPDRDPGLPPLSMECKMSAWASLLPASARSRNIFCLPSRRLLACG